MQILPFDIFLSFYYYLSSQLLGFGWYYKLMCSLVFELNVKIQVCGDLDPGPLKGIHALQQFC